MVQIGKRYKGWHPEDIKAAVRKQGVTLTRLARDNGLPEHACRAALYRPHFRAELVIAEFLGLSPRQIWPGRFLPDGARAHRAWRDRKFTSAPPGGHANSDGGQSI